MKAQDIFNRAYTTLRDRGFKRAGRGGGSDFVCTYRSDIGPCAAGLFILDEDYDEEKMEGRSVTNHAVRSYLPTVEGADGLGNFWLDLQNAHDFGYTPEEMESRLRDFATRFNLEVPA